MFKIVLKAHSLSLCFTSLYEPIMINTGSSAGTFSQIILTITVIGTASTRPQNPQSQPQADSDTIMMNGDSPRF